MNIQVTISIIVPAYNVTTFIRRCIESILSQSWKDWELILVNDGSTDNTGDICEEYAACHENITVVHKANGGVSLARNVGLRLAKGEWVTFIDGDDFISPTFLEDLFEPVREHPDLTFVHCGCMNYYSEDRCELNQKYEFHISDDKSYVFEHFRGLVVSKLLRKDIIEENAIRFDERIRKAEDYIFTLTYLFHIKSYAFVESTGYYYNMRQGSATRTSVLAPYTDGLWIVTKAEASLTLDYIERFNPDEKAVKKRKGLAGTTLSQLLTIYRYQLSYKKRQQIFSEFNDLNVKDLLNCSNVGMLRKLLILGLTNSRSFPLIDRVLSILYRE